MSRLLRHSRLRCMMMAGFMLFILSQSALAQQDDMTTKAAAIHRSLFTVDSHTDTPLRLMQPGFDLSVKHDYKTDYSRVDFPRMHEGGLDAAFFAVFVSQGPRDLAGNTKAKAKAMALFDTIDAAMKRSRSQAEQVTSFLEAEKAVDSGKLAIFIGIENGYVIGNDLSLISTFYLRGARYITLCHTKNNDICDSFTDTLGYGGLSPFGREVVKEMNRVGMMVDISHISDQSVRDVLEVSEAPVIASHSCAKALCDNPRNLTDDLLKAVARKGGVVQMCILSDYVKTPPPHPERDSARAAVRKQFNNFENLTSDEMKVARKAWYDINDRFPPQLATVSDVADHIDHIVKVAGIKHVGIGTDFDGGGGVEGCMDASQMGHITLELLKRGYSEKQLRLIWGGNLKRVLERVEKIALKEKNRCHCL